MPEAKVVDKTQATFTEDGGVLAPSGEKYFSPQIQISLLTLLRDYPRNGVAEDKAIAEKDWYIPARNYDVRICPMSIEAKRFFAQFWSGRKPSGKWANSGFYSPQDIAFCMELSTACGQTVVVDDEYLFSGEHISFQVKPLKPQK